MSSLQIVPNIDLNPWTDLKETVKQGRDGTVERIGRLPRGMESGASSIALVIKLNDGSYVIGQMSLKQFNLAHQAINVAEGYEKDLRRAFNKG